MATRHEMVERFKQQLDRWNASLDEMQLQMSLGKAEAREELDKQMADLRRLRDEAADKLRQAQAAGESAWSDMRGGTERAFAALGEAFDRARQRFGGK